MSGATLPRALHERAKVILLGESDVGKTCIALSASGTPVPSVYRATAVPQQHAVAVSFRERDLDAGDDGAAGRAESDRAAIEEETPPENPAAPNPRAAFAKMDSYARFDPTAMLAASAAVDDDAGAGADGGERDSDGDGGDADGGDGAEGEKSRTPSPRAQARYSEGGGGSDGDGAAGVAGSGEYRSGAVSVSDYVPAGEESVDYARDYAVAEDGEEVALEERYEGDGLMGGDAIPGENKPSDAGGGGPARPPVGRNKNDLRSRFVKVDSFIRFDPAQFAASESGGGGGGVGGGRFGAGGAADSDEDDDDGADDSDGSGALRKKTMDVALVDTCGSTERRALHLTHLRGADAVIVVFDVSSPGALSRALEIHGEDAVFCASRGAAVVLAGTRRRGRGSPADRAAALDESRRRGWKYVEIRRPADGHRAVSEAAAGVDAVRRRAERGARERAERAARAEHETLMRDPLTVRAQAGAARRSAAPIVAVQPRPGEPLPRVEACLVDVIMESYTGDRDPRTQAPHGDGIAEFVLGGSYRGGFEAGLPHGRGVYTWPDGATYVGEFRHGEPHGSGELTWSNGDRYVGQVRHGWRHGRGTFTPAEGYDFGAEGAQGAGVGGAGSGADAEAARVPGTYDGEWHMGVRHGRGVLAYGGASVYDGDWFRGLRQGQGRMVYPSGNEYVGGWRRGERHGRGAMLWRSRGETYEGHWRRGRAHGIGTHTWAPRDGYPLPNRYHGEFRKGERHGHGEFLYSTGARYEGSWRRNRKHGHGTMVRPDGSRYEGPFEDDRMVGSAEDDEPGPGEGEREAQARAEAPPRLGFQLNFDGVPGAEAGAGETERTEGALLRHLPELRAAYDRYARLSREVRAGEADSSSSPPSSSSGGLVAAVSTGTGAPSAPGPAPMSPTSAAAMSARGGAPPPAHMRMLSLSELVHFFVTAGVPSREVSAVQLCSGMRADEVSPPYPLPSAALEGIPESQHPGATFLFRHFLECVIRAAAVRYAPDVATGDGETALSARVAKLCEENLPRAVVTDGSSGGELASRSAERFAALSAAFESRPVQQLLSWARPILAAEYASLREPRVPRDLNSAGLATARNVVVHLRDLGTVSAVSSTSGDGTPRRHLLTPTDVLEEVIARYDGDGARDAPDEIFDAARDELTLAEYERLLVSCAVRAFDPELTPDNVADATRRFLADMFPGERMFQFIPSDAGGGIVVPAADAGGFMRFDRDDYDGGARDAAAADGGEYAPYDGHSNDGRSATGDFEGDGVSAPHDADYNDYDNERRDDQGVFSDASDDDGGEE